MSIVIWKSIPGFNHYEISDAGLVRRIKAPQRGRGCKEILPYLLQGHSKGKPPLTYNYVCLSQEGKRTTIAIHTLVCSLFNGPRPSMQHQVAHTDGNPKNNTPTNLRWATSLENHADKLRHGTQAKGERVGSAKLSEPAILLIRRIYDSKIANQSEIARAFGVSQAQISHIILNKHWKYLLTVAKG